MTRRLRLTQIPLACLVALGGVLAHQQEAHALQGGEDPALLPVLIDKRYGSDNAHQLGLQFTTSFATKFVESVGVYGTYGYNFNDLIGLELGAGYFFGTESSIMDTVRLQFGGNEPPLSDLYQLQWMANLDVVLVPFYGRISIASELDPSWDVFALAGAGVFGLRKQIGAGDAKSYDSSVGPGFNFGGGFRFYFNLGKVRTALRLEFREYMFIDPTDLPPEAEADSITWNLHFQGGFQLLF